MIIFSKKELQVSKKAETNPPLLVAELTKNKKTEKEKFDILFGWVATHITYDYRSYFAPGGTYSNIQTILKRKSAICLGYAELMDSLCKLAGITNVSVYGYAKEELFDVGDSLFLDNHAWNAVKLEGLWYVYDITWSTGAPQYTMSRFNKWKLKVLTNAKEKFKMKKIPKRKRFFRKDDCGNQYSSPAYKYKQKFFNKLYLRFLRNRFHIYVSPGYSKAVRSDYYLCQPEVFALTHFPDDHAWSLLEGKNMRSFENDSAYYFLHDSVYKNQVREGKECTECDQYAEANNYSRNLILKQNSFVLNKKNQFIQSLCAYKTAKFNYNSSIIEADSLTRIKYIDSAVTCLAESKSRLNQTKTGLAKEFKLLTTKNKKKLNLVVKENKLHKKFISDKVKATGQEMRNYNRMFSKSKAYVINYGKRALSLKRVIPIEGKPNTRKNKSKITAAERKLKKKEIIIDSLNKKIEVLKTEFNKEIEKLSLTTWQQAMNHDSLLKPFKKCIWLRRRNQDNYKKIMVDARNALTAFEEVYSRNINSVVYRPATRIDKNHKEIIALLNVKYALEVDCIKLKKDLVKWDEITSSEFILYRREIISNRKIDVCWLENYIPHIISVANGFEILRTKQRRVVDIIDLENSVERTRHSKINKEYLRRDKKHKNICIHNARLLNITTKEYQKFKRSITKPKRKK